MKANHEKDHQGINYQHTHLHELYSACSKQQITASWVSVEDTIVQILLKIARVAEIITYTLGFVFFKLKVSAAHIFPCQLLFFFIFILKRISV